MAKKALDRAYAGPKTHQKWPETWLGSMKIRAPLYGLKCLNTKKGERGSQLSDFGAQNYMLVTKNLLDFNGQKGKQSAKQRP